MTDDLRLDPDARLPYCRGCGHSHVVRHLSDALATLSLPQRSIVLTTDIGCLGLADALFPHLHTVHTTHGRSTAFAAGLALADAALGEGLKPVVMIGDGGAMIGLLHLVHAAQLNVDVTVLLHNNFVFGMTGGQHSALTPTGMVTRTTPGGNTTPPLDLAALLGAAHAGFLARQYATAPDLPEVIADAISYPGFALVEILELCTAFAVKENALTGRTLKEWVEGRGLSVGRLRQEDGRRDFAGLWREQHPRHEEAHDSGGGDSDARHPEPTAGTEAVFPPPSPAVSGNSRRVGLVLAGSAGERVQSSARLLCEAALHAGLFATQKNDNPVTQGTGFSLSEVCIAGQAIDYTGIELPEAVVVTSADGLQELSAVGIFERCGPDTLIVADAGLDIPETPASLWRLPLRKKAGAPRAALAALAAWSARTGDVPLNAWEAALAGLAPARREQAERALQAGRDLAATVAAAN